MADIVPITFSAGELPIGFCPQSEQERFNVYTQNLTGTISATEYNFGNDVPAVDKQHLPWVRTNANGSFDAVYTFYNGAWVTPYSVPAGPNDVRWLWVGTLAALETFDGGSAGVVTELTGPFWEQDTDWTDKILIGAGANAAVSTNASQLASGTSATDQVRGTFIIKRTARTFKTA